MYRCTNLIALRHKRLVGGFLDDMTCAAQERLAFYRWLYQQGRLSDDLPGVPRPQVPLRVPPWQPRPTVTESAANEWERINAALKEAFGW